MNAPNYLFPPPKPEPDPEWKSAVTLEQAIARRKAAGEDTSSLESWLRQVQLRAKARAAEVSA
jgi:hypothetical protein